MSSPVTAMPTSGKICVDTQAVIYTVVNHGTYAPRLAPLWAALASGRAEVVASEITLMESLVVPLRRADREEVEGVEELLLRHVGLLPVTRPVLRRAAELRAANGRLSTPDVIVLATAELAGCGHIVTNDLAWRGRTPLPAVFLEDLTMP